MSFSKFYGAYDFNTFYIDKCIKCEKEQLKYYNLWCEKYNKCFSKCTTDELGEWIIRYYKALWEMYSSSSIYTEAEVHLNNNCFISYYFCLYYSLFHAMNALIYLDPHILAKTVYRISHYKLKNIFKSDFCNSKGIFDNSVIKLFEDLKFKREYFSYSSPMNMVYDSWEKDINVVKDMLCKIYQVLALHSSIAKKEFPFLQYSNITNKKLFSLKFKSYFSNIDIVSLNENLKELKRKKRNEKARLRRREQRLNIMINSIKAGENQYSKRNIRRFIKDRNGVKDYIITIENSIDKIKCELDRVKLDPAAETLLCELRKEYYCLNFGIIQLEIEHIFDEFHGYDYGCWKNKVPIKFDSMKADSFIYSCIVKG